MTPERPQTTRERIVQGARQVFARLGYAEARVEDILLAAGVSRPTFYRVFRNKEEVYGEVSHEHAPRPRSARERVLEGAREAFGRLGYEAVRVEDILETSGVSRPTFYRVFSSKQEAHHELERMAMRYLLEALRAVDAREPDHLDRLELTIASFFEWRLCLRLRYDGAEPNPESPGLRELRAEAFAAGDVHALRRVALCAAIDVLAGSFVDDACRAPDRVDACRAEAARLVLAASGLKAPT